MHAVFAKFSQKYSIPALISNFKSGSPFAVNCKPMEEPASFFAASAPSLMSFGGPSLSSNFLNSMKGNVQKVDKSQNLLSPLSWRASVAVTPIRDNPMHSIWKRIIEVRTKWVQRACYKVSAPTFPLYYGEFSATRGKKFLRAEGATAMFWFLNVQLSYCENYREFQS